MQIRLYDYKGQKEKKNIITTFASLPSHATELTVKGGFFVTNQYSKKVAQGLNLLPYHVKKVSFDGHYHVELSFGEIKFDLGRALIEYCNALPDSVTSLSLKFTEQHIYSEITHNDKRLTSLIKNLKKNITELDLSEINISPRNGVTVTQNMYSLYEKIPPTVTSLKLTHNLGRIPETIKKLHFYDTKWAALTVAELGAYIASLPRNLKSLDIEQCGLGNLGLAKFNIIMENLPKNNLVKLGLNNNFLNRLADRDLTDFIKAIEKIPASVEEVNFSGNDWLEYDKDKLTKILNGLPKTVTRLQLNLILMKRRPELCTKLDNMKTLLRILPDQINTLILQKMIIHNRKAALQVADALADLPKTVNTIDFSELFSQDTDIHDILIICNVFANLPASITHIKLFRNNLGLMPPDVFRTILSSFSNHIKTIDISDNNFTDLPPARLQQLVGCCPQNTTNILLDNDKFIRKLNGMLALKTDSAVYMDFPNPVMIPKEFARLTIIFTLVLTLLQRDKKLPAEICWRILYEAFPNIGSDQKRKAYFEKKMTKKFFPVHSLADNQKSVEIMDNAKQRLLNQTTMADLSHCGLHLLQQSELTKLMKTIVPSCERINLRSNGFGSTKKNREKLAALLTEIPPHIKYIDLGANDLELANADEIDALIPKKATYFISLGEEMPLTREEHLILRKSYSTYDRMHGSESELIEYSLKLLQEYTQHPRARIRYFDEVKRLEQQIKYKQITRMDDLFYQLELINEGVPTSSLAQLIYRLRNTLVLVPEQEQQSSITPGASGANQ